MAEYQDAGFRRSIAITTTPLNAREETMIGDVARQGQLWSVILAGGDGERMKSFILQQFGYHKPKQYCTFVGRRSLLQHTVDRAHRLTPPERTVTVIAKTHQEFFREQVVDPQAGVVIAQPQNRDTAAGIYLALTYVKVMDPQATIVLFPSDHFIYPEDCFHTTVRQMVAAVNECPDRMLLLGAVPDTEDMEYGWIQPGPHMRWIGEDSVRAVEAFHEKPNPITAGNYRTSTTLWNTLILAANVETVWRLGHRHFDRLMKLFEMLGEAVATSDEKEVLERIYREMPKHNFSSDLLMHATDRLAVMELSNAMWSDWGKPERIAETLRRLNKTPAFSFDTGARSSP